MANQSVGAWSEAEDAKLRKLWPKGISASPGKAVIAGTADAANDNAIRLLDRRFGQCAWPVGIPVRPAEQMVCGDAIYPEIENCSYCLIHAKRAFSRDITQPKPKDDLVRSARRWAA